MSIISKSESNPFVYYVAPQLEHFAHFVCLKVKFPATNKHWSLFRKDAPACEFSLSQPERPGLKLEETDWKGWAFQQEKPARISRYSMWGAAFSCVFSLSQNQTLQGVVSWAYRLLCSSPEQSFSSEAVWVGMPPVCLSVCCCSAPSSRLSQSTWANLLCTGLFWMGFFSWRACGALFSFQAPERGDLAPHFLSELMVEMELKTYTTPDLKIRNRLSLGLPLSLSVRFPEEVLLFLSEVEWPRTGAMHL